MDIWMKSYMYTHEWMFCGVQSWTWFWPTTFVTNFNIQLSIERGQNVLSYISYIQMTTVSWPYSICTLERERERILWMRFCNDFSGSEDQINAVTVTPLVNDQPIFIACHGHPNLAHLPLDSCKCFATSSHSVSFGELWVAQIYNLFQFWALKIWAIVVILSYLLTM